MIKLHTDLRNSLIRDYLFALFVNVLHDSFETVSKKFSIERGKIAISADVSLVCLIDRHL